MVRVERTPGGARNSRCYTKAMATDARLTAQDLLRLGNGDIRRELVNGRVIEMPPGGFEHGEIAGAIISILREYLKHTDLGRVATNEVGFVLSVPGDPERVRGADVAFVARERLPAGSSPKGFINGPPDLAVEVLSPSDDILDAQQKVRDYLDAGARLIWVVAPNARTVTIYRADGSARLLREDDALSGEDVLPGLSIPLTDIFTEIVPD